MYTIISDCLLQNNETRTVQADRRSWCWILWWEFSSVWPVPRIASCAPCLPLRRRVRTPSRPRWGRALPCRRCTLHPPWLPLPLRQLTSASILAASDRRGPSSRVIAYCQSRISDWSSKKKNSINHLTFYTGLRSTTSKFTWVLLLNNRKIAITVFVFSWCRCNRPECRLPSSPPPKNTLGV